MTRRSLESLAARFRTGSGGPFDPHPQITICEIRYATRISGSLPVAILTGKRIAEEMIALVPAKVATEHDVVPLIVKSQGRTTQLFARMEDSSHLELSEVRKIIDLEKLRLHDKVT